MWSSMALFKSQRPKKHHKDHTTWIPGRYEGIVAVVLIVLAFQTSILSDLMSHSKHHGDACETNRTINLAAFIGGQKAIEHVTGALTSVYQSASMKECLRIHIVTPLPLKHEILQQLTDLPSVDVVFHDFEWCKRAVKPFSAFVETEAQLISDLCKPLLYELVPDLTSMAVVDTALTVPSEDISGCIPEEINTLFGLMPNLRSPCLGEPDSCWPSALNMPSSCIKSMPFRSNMFVPHTGIILMNPKKMTEFGFKSKYLESIVRAYRVTNYTKSALGSRDLLNAFFMMHPETISLLPQKCAAFTEQRALFNDANSISCDNPIPVASCPNQEYNCSIARAGEVFLDEPVYVLTRTSGRPAYFEVCHESVLTQSHPNTKHLIVTDNPEDAAPLSKLDADYTLIDKNKYGVFNPEEPCNRCALNKSEGCTIKDMAAAYMRAGIDTKKFFDCYCSTNYPMNAYFEELHQRIEKPGFIMYMDDDSKFVHEHAVMEIMAHVSSKDQMTIWQACITMQTPTPYGKYWGNIQMGGIDTSTFMFHTNYVNDTRWRMGVRCGDFWTASSLGKALPQQEWIHNVFIQSQSGQFGYGLRADKAQVQKGENLERCLKFAHY